jgi:hypothetical protein
MKKQLIIAAAMLSFSVAASAQTQPAKTPVRNAANDAYKKAQQDGKPLPPKPTKPSKPARPKG